MFLILVSTYRESQYKWEFSDKIKLIYLVPVMYHEHYSICSFTIPASKLV